VRRWAKVVQAGTKDDVLVDPLSGLFNDQILDEARTGYDGCAEQAGALGVHVRTVAPVVVRGRQF
jgi:hypothetical protein